MSEPFVFRASSAINGQIGAGLVVLGRLEIPTQRSDNGGDGLALCGEGRDYHSTREEADWEFPQRRGNKRNQSMRKQESR